MSEVAPPAALAAAEESGGMSEEKRQQVTKQCEVVAHLAKVLEGISADYAEMLKGGGLDNVLEMIGRRTACHMEILGDILNGMDEATEEDNWMVPVFEEARRLWPNALEDEGWFFA